MQCFFSSSIFQVFLPHRPPRTLGLRDLFVGLPFLLFHCAFLDEYQAHKKHGPLISFGGGGGDHRGISCRSTPHGSRSHPLSPPPAVLGPSHATHTVGNTVPLGPSSAKPTPRSEQGVPSGQGRMSGGWVGAGQHLFHPRIRLAPALSTYTPIQRVGVDGMFPLHQLLDPAPLCMATRWPSSPRICGTPLGP